jgi:hypothetical protein
MKIGILTYHRSYNYGALLQAIALREILVSEGHQVFYVDYWPAYHRHRYALFSFSWMMSRKSLRGKLGYIKDSIFNYRYRKMRNEKFVKFISQYIEPFALSCDDTYDVIIHGSDQIWRKQPEMNKYNPIYFGKNQIKAYKKISYAASMGILPDQESDFRTLKSYISHLTSISVREGNLLNLIEQLGFTNVTQDLDPTLLTTSDFWVNRFKLRKYNEKYALCYQLQDTFSMSDLIRYTEEKGLKLIVVQGKRPLNSLNQTVVASPEQFLELIYGAEIVFTSSFHGVALSLLFHKPFYASFDNNANRVLSLLKILKLEYRVIPPKSSLKEIDYNIDYTQVDQMLNRLRNKSLSRLLSMIS